MLLPFWNNLAQGAAGGKRKKPRYIERDGEILMFSSARAVENYLDQEVPPEVPRVKKRGRPKKYPVRVNVAEFDQYSGRLGVYQPAVELAQSDPSYLIKVYQRIMELREEDDIEAILLAA